MTNAYCHLRVAVVGYGSIGRRHVENLGALGVEQITIVRRVLGFNPAFTPPPRATIVHTVEAALDRELDLAIVCNPTSLHLKAAQPFVAASVPVLIEKPIAASLEQLQEAESWLAGASSSIGIAYCLRYHPAYLAARDALHDGSMGDLLSARTWFESYLPDWHPWEDYRVSYASRPELGGGVLPTLDHELDFLHWCLGTPIQVRGWSARSGALEMPADDLAEFEMCFANDVWTTTRLSMCRRDRSRGFEFVGTRDVLGFDWEGGRLAWQPKRGCIEPAKVLWQDGGYDVNRMYFDLLRDALEAVVAGQRLPIPWQAGLEALRSATAAISLGCSIVPSVPTPSIGHLKARVFA